MAIDVNAVTPHALKLFVYTDLPVLLDLDDFLAPGPLKAFLDGLSLAEWQSLQAPHSAKSGALSVRVFYHPRSDAVVGVGFVVVDGEKIVELENVYAGSEPRVHAVIEFRFHPSGAR